MHRAYRAWAYPEVRVHRAYRAWAYPEVQVRRAYRAWAWVHRACQAWAWVHRACQAYRAWVPQLREPWGCPSWTSCLPAGTYRVLRFPYCNAAADRTWTWAFRRYPEVPQQAASSRPEEAPHPYRAHRNLHQTADCRAWEQRELPWGAASEEAAAQAGQVPWAAGQVPQAAAQQVLPAVREPQAAAQQVLRAVRELQAAGQVLQRDGVPRA